MTPSPLSSNHEQRPGRSSGMIALTLLAACLLPTVVRGQSLAESAQKEKERRESVRTKKTVVVTNADLSKVKKKSAVAMPSAPAPNEAQAQAGAALGAGTETSVSTGQGAPPRTAEIPASVLEGNPKAVFDQKKADLESRWNAARERWGLLEVKLLALRQQAASAVNAAEKDRVGKEIEGATQTLASAQLDEKKAREELDRFLAPPPPARK
jgi:hypothetical protein